MKKIFNNYFLLFFSAGITVLSSCETKENKPAREEAQKTAAVIPVVAVPEFNQDSAFSFIEKQVSFGPRVPNTATHDKCADYLVNKLKAFDLNIIVQEGKVTAFDNTVLNIKNIIAEYKPELNNRILLVAHWDTRPFADQDTKQRNEPILGANDGASGVGVLLEVARSIKNSGLNIGVDIILFDAEDYGQPEGTMIERKSDTYCLGSQYWAKNMHKPNYSPRYGILLDMVGSKGATFAKEGTSMHFAPEIVKKVWIAASKIGYSDYFINFPADPITDDHLYINAIAKIPTIDIIHYDANTKSNFGAYWHTHNDNMEVIDKNTLKAVGQTLLEVICTEK